MRPSLLLGLHSEKQVVISVCPRLTCEMWTKTPPQPLHTMAAVELQAFRTEAPSTKPDIAAAGRP